MESQHIHTSGKNANRAEILEPNPIPAPAQGVVSSWPHSKEGA